MATKYWLGVADAVAQVSTVQITAFDASTTYKLTVGGVEISVTGDTDADTTASNLSTAWNDSTHPYCTGVTATVSTDTVTLTADTAGVPFVVTSSVSGGTGTIGSVTQSTASAGPNDWSTADNWSDGSIPANTDTVIFKDNAVNVCWGLDQSSVTIDDLFIEKTYTGRIGLDLAEFATSADGETTNSAKPEYREDYLLIDYDVLEIGKHVGGGSPTGSARIKIDNQNSGASTTTIFDTASAASESALAAVRLLAASATADFYIRDGSVGIGIDEPNETATVGDVYVEGTGAECYIGDGVTITSYTQVAGTGLLQAAATVTTVKLINGTLRIEGSFTITTLTQEGGTLYDNHTAAGNAVTTANLNGGTTDATESSQARTWATVNLGDNANLLANSDFLTITTLNEPSGEYTLSLS